MTSRLTGLGFLLHLDNGPGVGATVPMAVERRAGVLGRSAPSRSRGLSAAHPQDLCLEFRS